MSQSRKQSLVEAASGTFLGTVGSFLITYLNMRYSALSTETTAVVIVLECTVWSLSRGYFMRRMFNNLSTRSET